MSQRAPRGKLAGETTPELVVMHSQIKRSVDKLCRFESDVTTSAFVYRLIQENIDELTDKVNVILSNTDQTSARAKLRRKRAVCLACDLLHTYKKHRGLRTYEEMTSLLTAKQPEWATAIAELTQADGGVRAGAYTTSFLSKLSWDDLFKFLSLELKSVDLEILTFIKSEMKTTNPFK